jgi:hypothetical protein
VPERVGLLSAAIFLNLTLDARTCRHDLIFAEVLTLAGIVFFIKAL